MSEAFSECEIKSKDGVYANVKYTFTCKKADGSTKEVTATLPSGNDAQAKQMCKDGLLP